MNRKTEWYKICFSLIEPLSCTKSCLIRKWNETAQQWVGTASVMAGLESTAEYGESKGVAQGGWRSGASPQDCCTGITQSAWTEPLFGTKITGYPTEVSLRLELMFRKKGLSLSENPFDKRRLFFGNQDRRRTRNGSRISTGELARSISAYLDLQAGGETDIQTASQTYCV